jgi:hypothetical protein
MNAFRNIHNKNVNGDTQIHVLQTSNVTRTKYKRSLFKKKPLAEVNIRPQFAKMKVYLSNVYDKIP